MKVLITGATGFVGRYVARQAATDGMDVRCFARPSSDRSPLAGLPVEWTIGTFDDPPALDAAVQDVDIVIHAAGLTRARSAEPYFRVNARATKQILDAVRRVRPGLRRFVYVSSLAAVGPGDPDGPPVDENRTPHPIDHYGRSKLEGECFTLAAGSDFPVTIVRPPGVYGPEERNFLPLYRTAHRYGILPLMGPRTRRFSLVHAADLARGILAAAKSATAAGRTYFITGGVHTPDDLCRALAAAFGKSLRILRLPAPVAKAAGWIGDLAWAVTGKPRIVCSRKVRDLLQPNWACSGERAATELGFEPKVPLEAGMRETVAWCLAQGLL